MSDINYDLSIIVVTYNHEHYIDKALEGLLNQQFEGTAEIIIADDSSTDQTISLIQQYEKKGIKYPFKYLDNSVNLGITKNYQRAFQACSGKYVVILEGDDYWISPFKLQQQIDFLNTHWECNLCSVNYFVFQESIAHYYPRIAIGNTYRLISARELIADNIVGNFSTCMYRKSALDNLPKELYETTSYDWIINICIARESLIGFLETPMSVYRLQQSGTWTQLSRIEKLQKQLDIIPKYDSLTNYIFHREFSSLSNSLKHEISIENIQKLIPNSYEGLLSLKNVKRWILLILPPIAVTILKKIIKRS